jgi:DNA repair protein RecO (recombination protein O)
MNTLGTDAIVLHVADYLESSRIYRLMTREAGVVSVMARGARNSRKRFGSGVDLFAEGQAQLQMKPGRDLQSLLSFDVQRSRPQLAADLGVFYGAAAIAEVTLRLVHEEAAPLVYDHLSAGLTALASTSTPTPTATPTQTAAPAVEASGYSASGVMASGQKAIAVGRSDQPAIAVCCSIIWLLISDIGYRPTLANCANCHRPISPNLTSQFSPQSGGVVCEDCAKSLPRGRSLPPDARAAIARWLDGDPVSGLSLPALRAHQRLLREFIAPHLPDSRPLKAYLTWESYTAT